MRLITKTKLINAIINDCKEWAKCIDYFLTDEMIMVIRSRILKCYNLNYTLDHETQLHLCDLIELYIYNGINKNLKKDLEDLIK